MQEWNPVTRLDDMKMRDVGRANHPTQRAIFLLETTP